LGERTLNHTAADAELSRYLSKRHALRHRDGFLAIKNPVLGGVC
jgi:hypothetical protein